MGLTRELRVPLPSIIGLVIHIGGLFNRDIMIIKLPEKGTT